MAGLDGIEHAVDEADAFVAGEAAGELERFIDDDGVGELGVEQLEGSEAKDVAIDAGHAVETPVFARAADFFVYFFATGHGAADELFHEAVARHAGEVFVLAVERDVEGFDGGLGFELAEIAQENNLERAFARFTPTGHGGLPLGAPEGAQQVGHFDGAVGGFGALVAHLAAGAVEGLFHGVGGEDAVHDGDAGFAGGAGEALGVFASDVIKVGRIAADDAAETDDGVEAGRTGEVSDEDRHFPCARHAKDLDMVAGGAGAGEGFEGAGEQTVCDEVVEAAHHDRDAEARGGAGTFLHLDFMGME